MSDEVGRRPLRALRRRAVRAGAAALGALAQPGAEFRRSHGWLYKALARGEIDDERLRRLLVEHRPTDWPQVFAVDATVWDRCDAECSPERGFYYSASKHSAGQPIVAGWSYQWISQLSFSARQLDGARRRAAHPAHHRRHRRHHRSGPPSGGCSRIERRGAPLFVFDAGYDPIALGHGLADMRAQVLVRIKSRPRLLRRSRHPDGDRPEADLLATGDASSSRTRRARPGPTPRSICDDPRYGTVRVRAWHDLHPKLHGRGRWAGAEIPDRAGQRDPRRRRASPEAHRTHQEDAVAVVVGARCARSRAVLPRLPAPLRHRAHLPLREEHPGVDDTVAAHARAGRPLDLARRSPPTRNSASPAGSSKTFGCRGNAASIRRSSPGACAPRVSSTSCNARHARQSTEIRHARSGTSRKAHERDRSSAIRSSRRALDTVVRV